MISLRRSEQIVDNIPISNQAVTVFVHAVSRLFSNTIRWYTVRATDNVDTSITSNLVGRLRISKFRNDHGLF